MLIQKYNIQDTIRDAMVLLLALAKDIEQLKINNDNNLKIREKWCNVVRNGNKQFRVPVEETKDAQRGKSRSPRRAIAIN